MLDRIFSPSFIQLITKNKEYIELNNIDRDLIELLVAGLFFFERKNIIWIVGENENLNEKKIKLKLWLKLFDITDDPVHFYTKPFEDPYINNEGNISAIINKTKLVSQLIKEKKLIIMTTLSALQIKMEQQNQLADFFLNIQVNQNLNRTELINQLKSMGYQGRDIVEEKGDIAWRGSIVDVFPIDNKYPLRIELEGNTLRSLRIFNPDTQKSLEKIQFIGFPMARFFLHYKNFVEYEGNKKENMKFLTDWFPHSNYRVVTSNLKRLNDEHNKLLLNYEKICEIAAQKEQKLLKPQQLFNYTLENKNLININETWDNISSNVEWLKIKKSVSDLNLEDFQYFNHKINSGQQLHIFSKDENMISRLAENITHFVHHPLKIPCSFENQNTDCIFLADQVFHYSEKIEKFTQLKSESFINQIQLNDLVVHKEHGIGRFVGFKKLSFENQINEFLKIEYLNKEYLYVPVYELDILNKYISFEGYTPHMDRLGGNTWATKKNKARKSMVLFAKELLELYAMRKAIKGNSYAKDPELEEKLEKDFQFIETEDQKKAINDVLKDLEAEFPMDRLICGDVSFGKTEVAIRASLRVISNGKQVALLCPTTILAYQHYNTFKQRFAPFPISIAMLSRMVSYKKKQSIYKDLANGKIDIIIGTHALIARDLQFKRLGLYIIDEEQRFGVFQKEKLKKSKEDIDVLSMSATPIPRTLSLSMAGLHDISAIQTPPLGRLSIKNYVGYFSKEIIISAILNEQERQGAVFIVYNDISKIYSFQDELKQWLPYIPSIVIHAKMKSEQIETNLMAFIQKKYQVLISTTIIENGIDIPDVNTLIILDADRFGLTQLYQLRGRIGRGNRQAYAYFLIKTMNLSDKAKSRLEAIREFTELGSGYKLAEFDLKLRGAGSLLGNRQHGHIEALGFDYYHQMLVKTINELKGDLKKEKESKINIHFSYSIDSQYIKNTSERINLYRKILEAQNFEDLNEIRVELEDRFGRSPESIEKIFFAGVIRIFAKKNQLEEVDVYTDKLIIKLPENLSLLDFQSSPTAHFSIEILDEKEKVWIFHFQDYKKFTEEIIKL